MNMATAGEVAGEVALIADELSRAVELTMDPTISHEDRTHAYNACESFKESSPWCAQAGLVLASEERFSAVVKHFGLQLMEHTVKYRWTLITHHEKLFIKENAMKLLYMGGWEAGHLNDALARVIVEMIKREWPQQWPTLLAELSAACARGQRHTMIVLHVFLRLVEDVATLQTLEQHQRRKDIYQALTTSVPEMFAFFLRLLEVHVPRARAAAPEGQEHARLAHTVLATLAGFAEWVPCAHVAAEGGRLPRAVCALLAEPPLQLPAADCLLVLVNRKGSTKERKPLMILFSEDTVSCIHRAALDAINTPDETHYLFLKKLSQVLVGMMGQLTSLYAHAVETEAWLGALLETLLALGAHPSPTLAHAALAAWLPLLKHEQLSRRAATTALLPRWLAAVAPNLLKVSYPSTREVSGHCAATYVALDYDSEHEFAAWFARARTDLLDGLRHCMSAAPLVTWAAVQQWTRAALAHHAASAEPRLDHHHPLYIEWEALSQVLDVVLSRVVTCSPRPAAGEGLALLRECVLCEPRDPLLLSLLLSFISALFVFLSCACSQAAGPGVAALGADLLPRVLDKIFAALATDGPDGAGGTRSRAVKNVRRHACGLLVKLGCKYPLLLLPVFGRLHESVRAAMARPGLSALESVTLQEALLVVANHLCCFERQSALVAQVLGDTAARWAALAPHLTSGRALAALVGLDRPPQEHPAGGCAEDEAGRARRTLLHALTLTLGVVKRTQVPADPDKASRGGFGAGVTAAGNPVWRNPCAAHVLPLLPYALALSRALHELHVGGGGGGGGCADYIHPAHHRALALAAAERRTLLGARDHDHAAAASAAASASPSPPTDRMQNFLHTLHDNTCHLVGAAAVSLGRELYGVSGLARCLSGSLLALLGALPDHWLRPLLRAALKPLLAHCPPAHYHSVALPLVEHVSVFMLQHLSARWEYISSLYESGKLEEEGSVLPPGAAESQEVLEDMLVRNLTREYLELLKIILVEGGGVSSAAVEPGAGDMDEDPPASAPTAALTARATDQLSELGALVLAHPVAGRATLHTIVRALTWGDSTASLRACALALPALRGAWAAGRLGAADAQGALAAQLQALRAHGQHDANQAALLALAVQTYELVRPAFPAVAGVLRAIPDVDAHDLARLDDKLLQQHAAQQQQHNGSPAPPPPPANNKTDKSKRELFKKITAKLIGRNVGQLFKKEVYIVDLPSMPRPPAPAAAPPLDADGASMHSLFAAHAHAHT